MITNTKKEKITEEVVVEGIITIDNVIMTIATEPIKIETETMMSRKKKEILKIRKLESTKTEIMEIKTMRKETITIKVINPETENKIANQEIKMTEKMEERKNITLKMNPKRRELPQEKRLLKRIKILLNQAIPLICLMLTAMIVKSNEIKEKFSIHSHDLHGYLNLSI